MEPLIGKTLGQYQIREKIGQGGMAKVFMAYQPGLDRLVAVKVLSPAMSQETGFTERFQREAHAIARLTHPNILPVYDFGVEAGYHYLVMRYVPESLTLSDLMQRNDIPFEQLISYVLQVADALHYAHERGVIHRDIKPGNILIDGKWAFLADFGLVKDNNSGNPLTGTGVGLGTPAYMSPEQMRGQGVDHRTDIYALGVILYKILTGVIPHDAPTPLAIMARRATEPIRPLRQVKPDVPPSLESVTMRALSPNPDARYPSAVHFAQALQRAYQDPTYQDEVTLPSSADLEATVLGIRAEAEQTLPGPPAAPSTPPARKNTGWLIGGGLAAIAIIGLLIFGRLAGEGGNPPPAPVTAVPTTFAGSPPPAVPATLKADEPLPPSPSPTPTASHTPLPPPPGTPQAAIKANVEVRSGPGNQYELLGYLPAGALAQITSRNEAGDWWQISSSLGGNGFGWIAAGDKAMTVTGVGGLPIALAPPTVTPTPPPPTPTPTAISLPTPILPASTPTPSPLPPSTPMLPSGQITLLEPNSLDTPSFGPTRFAWHWAGPLAQNQGFEVRVWQDGEPPAGVHNAVLDNRDGTVQALNNGDYRLSADITTAAGVRQRSGLYHWTVLLVQIEPEYKELGIQGPVGQLRFEMPGAGGSNGGGGTSGGGGGAFN